MQIHFVRIYLFIYSLDVLSEFGEPVRDGATVQLAKNSVISSQFASRLQQRQPQTLCRVTEQNSPSRYNIVRAKANQVKGQLVVKLLS